MKGDRLEELKGELISIVGSENLLIDPRKTRFYRTGIRVGNGQASMVVFPSKLLDLWKILETCISLDKIIIIQAANTGLTGGSTPFGDDYDRDVIIINTININKLILINKGQQVIAFPGTTLYQLEDNLLPLGRGPHSVIGSSCIGASVIGGVCNNSGGNLVKRGPAYTELSLFARLNRNGKLELVNHLGIELGKSVEEILVNLEAVNFSKENVIPSLKIASDSDYQNRIRDIHASSPARFNADKRRLYESSGCAGKIAVFAVRLDTFSLPEREQVFFLGTNNPDNLTKLRQRILTEFPVLPDMGEYMHRSYFDGSYKYCKDLFILIKFFGTKSLPRIFYFKRIIDEFVADYNFLPTNFSDKALQFLSSIMPNHLPKILLKYRDYYEHLMLFAASDEAIESMVTLLDEETKMDQDYQYIKCTKSEGKDALLHRYVAGSAPGRYQKLNLENSAGIIPLDIALPRNFVSWSKLLPNEILSQMAESFQMGHFLCMVFHLDFVVKKGVNIVSLKEKILAILDKNNAKYPAEHNVGHLYRAEEDLKDFYQELDPTNTFNSGIGKTSKKKNYE